MHAYVHCFRFVEFVCVKVHLLKKQKTGSASVQRLLLVLLPLTDPNVTCVCLLGLL